MLLSTVKYRGYTIEVYPDENSSDPRLDQDNLGTMVCWHSRYDLGDLQGDDEFISPEDFLEWAESVKAIVLPLFLYDHSGISMSVNRSYPFNCPWDSGQVGWIYVTRERLRKEFDWKRITKGRIEKAVDLLIDEVKTYDQFLTGDVYGYQSEVGSGWNYFGSDGQHDMIAEAKSEIDAELGGPSIYPDDVQKAMRKLLEYYQAKLQDPNIPVLDACPLCDSGRMAEKGTGCLDCPWVVETGKICMQHQEWFIAVLGEEDSTIPKRILVAWYKRRIKELTEWLTH